MTLTMNEIYDEILRDGGMTPSKKIKQTSIRFPEKIAMRYKEFGVWQETTFEEFWKKSNYLSMGLKFFGIEKGDSVAIHSENRPEWFIADIGIQSLGAVSVGLYPTNPASEVEYLLSHSESKILFAEDQEQVDKALQVIENLPLLEKIVYFEDRGLYSYDHPKLMRFDEFLEIGKSEYESFPEYVDQQLEEINDEDVAFLVYTSGTTGKPKGCVYTHIGLVAKMSFDEGVLADFRQTDIHLCMADMGWMVGSKSATIASAHGAQMVIAEGVPDFPDEVRFWKLIEKYKVSWTELSPALIRAQMIKDEKLFKDLDLSSLRMICTGGEPWTEKPWKWLFQVIGKSKVPIMNSAGGTEVSGSILHCCLHRPFKVGSFNAPIPGMSADILNLDGKKVSTNEMGELVMRKSSIGLTKSLWNDDKRYIDNYWSVIEDYWVHGDLASRDADGHWYLHGRSDDTIKVSGKRIGPSELESVIIKTGKAKEVAAVGIPDENKGSKIILSIVPAENNDQKESFFEDLVIKDLGKSFKP